MAFFFRYLGTWLAPWPGWMAIDVRAALTQSPAVLAGAIAWLAWPVAGAVLLMQRGRAGLAGLAMLAPWLLALPELATVRVQEPFVLYRSYLWMALLPVFLPLVRPRRWHAVGAGVLLIAFSGAAWERIGTFSSAAALWEDALKKTDPAAPFAERAWIGRGLAHLGAGRAESARADFERALEINPRAPEAWLGRGTLRLRAGRLDEAIADFDRALALDAKYASAYNKRCVARAGLGLERDALADCERALALDPADDEAWINAGTLQRSLGQRTRAVASYRHALEIRPSSGSAHFNYAVLLMESGAQAEAEGHLSAACSARVAEACAILRRK
jgi:Tfp pilus assembly protein PilF